MFESLAQHSRPTLAYAEEPSTYYLGSHNYKSQCHTPSNDSVYMKPLICSN